MKLSLQKKKILNIGNHREKSEFISFQCNKNPFMRPPKFVPFNQTLYLTEMTQDLLKMAGVADIKNRFENLP